MAVSKYFSAKSEIQLHEGHRDERQIKRFIGTTPVKAAFATYLSFFFIGLIPLLPFLFSFSNQVYNFRISIALTAIAFFIIGLLKGEIVKKHPIKSAFETLIIGAIAASLAFIVGYFLKGIIQ